jgi:hypothetical protein
VVVVVLTVLVVLTVVVASCLLSPCGIAVMLIQLPNPHTQLYTQPIVAAIPQLVAAIQTFLAPMQPIYYANNELFVPFII